MIERYADERIAKIWSLENKYRLWQETEIAVLRAREAAGELEVGLADKIATELYKHPISVGWIAKREKEVHHDLNAFLDERLQHLPCEWQAQFHYGMTSYDTEEPASARMLVDSCNVVIQDYLSMEQVLAGLARRYRYTVMMGRTHGQEAELQSFGKRVLTWLQGLRVSRDAFFKAMENTKYSKLSGAVGNYQGLSPKVESQALKLLGFEPFYGATQIMPRELYAPLAQSLAQINLSLNKIATDIWLGARSGTSQLYQEPFGKKQKGSSAMPHKQNPITTERTGGMAPNLSLPMAQGLTQNILTCEERDIGQSCVERVFWPDIFHTTVGCIKGMTRVLSGLRVYPDNMMSEITDLNGCYASGEAKEFLRKEGTKFGLSTEDAYRIVQLAAFNAFEAESWRVDLRKKPYDSLEAADAAIMSHRGRCLPTEHKLERSIETIISCHELSVSSELEASQQDVDRWNEALVKMFEPKSELWKEWGRLFMPSYLLRNEAILFEKILGDK